MSADPARQHTTRVPTPTVRPAPPDPWAEPPDAVAAALAVDVAAGLSDDVAAARLTAVGPNDLHSEPARSPLTVLVHQFASPLVALLAAAALLSGLFGQWAEAVAVIAVLLLNAAIGFVTELRAVRSVESLRSLGAASCAVRRGGRPAIVAAASVVPGDILLLNGGDVVAADARLVLAHGLQVDESALTGESVPVDKGTAPVPHGSPIHERSSQVFKGTAVTRGSAEAVVTATGMATELGHVADMVGRARSPATPLEQRLDALARSLVWVTLVVAVAVTASGLGTGKGWLVLVQTAIALAIATIPEGLPIIATLTLARGVRRLAERNALVARLSAVETLGATSVIITDKTGTLTENRMTVAELWLPAGRGRPGDAHDDGGWAADMRRTLTVAAACTTAELDAAGADGTRAGAGPGSGVAGPAAGGVGDPLEVALLEAASAVGITPARLERALPRVAVAAFESDTMMMATLHEADDGSYLVAVKGAPEPVLRACRRVASHGGDTTLADEELGTWLQRNAELARSGLRVLAIAERRLDHDPRGEHADATDTDSGRDDAGPYRDLTLLGLVAFLDPPRSDVAASLAAAHAAGIRVVMATGDQAATATAVAAAVGLAPADSAVVEGHGFDELVAGGDAGLRSLLDRPILARVSPEQKLRLIEAYQASGAVVAMTGDGVNDAPALRRADIGVAMGRRGTDVAREAADMILTDDAFPTIVAAVREGRVIFDNIRAFVVYLLSCNLSEVLVVGLAAVLGYPLPLLPLQILFINLVTDVLPALALGNGEGDAAVMLRRPRDPAEPLLARRHWWSVVGYAVLITASVLGAFVFGLETLDLSIPQAVTVSFTTLALAQVWHVFSMREPGTGWVRNALTRNRAVWLATAVCTGAMLAVNAWQPLRTVLHLEPLPGAGWALIAVAALAPALIGQALKLAGFGRVA